MGNKEQREEELRKLRERHNKENMEINEKLANPVNLKEFNKVVREADELIRKHEQELERLI
jgi:hypothetical protein